MDATGRTRAEDSPRLLTRKLVALGMLIPVGEGVYEWPRAYRDLMFEIGDFLREAEAPTRDDAPQQLRLRSRVPELSSFTDAELTLLIRKAAAYGFGATGAFDRR